MVALAVAAPGCGGEASAPESVRVSIADFRFAPKAIEVRAGGKVTWTNSDVAPHTATADDRAAFDTGTLRTRDAKTVELREPGIFGYVCEFHPFMRGTIEVEG
jgi:plastocyanin